MPAVETFLLPLAVVLALLGVVYTGVNYRRGRRGRVVQGVALVLAPIALYLAGLLRLVWDAAGAILDWVGATAFAPTIWAGLGLLGVCVGLWFIGAVVTKRSPAPTKKSRKQPAADASSPKATGRKSVGKSAPASAQIAPAKNPTRSKPAPPVDDDMAEIEALLKSRGID